MPRSGPSSAQAREPLPDAEQWASVDADKLRDHLRRRHALSTWHLSCIRSRRTSSNPTENQSMKHIVLRVCAALALCPGPRAAGLGAAGSGHRHRHAEHHHQHRHRRRRDQGAEALEKYLPKTGKYKDIEFKLDWQNFTSGPPVTNGMMAKKLHIGMMGDYPLLVNGATGQAQPGNETQLVAIIAYNAFGSGNGVVVHKDSPYYELADLKGKLVSVPFGSAAHGMVLQAMQDARLEGRLLEPRQPEPRGRHHQPAGKEDRRARRLRALRRPAAVPRLRPQDLRRRRDQGADLPRRRRAQGLRRRSIPRSSSPTSRR